MRPQIDFDTVAEIKGRLAKFPARIVNLTISGSHLYGFESPNSDIDYRGMFQINSTALLGLRTPDDHIEFKFKENDIALSELKKEVNLALAGNCNVLEHFNAKQVISTPEFLKIRQAINNAFGKDGLMNSYKGMAIHNYHKFVLGGKATPKKYLYVFRGIMAGIYVLQTGQIEPNMEVLNDYFKIPEIKEIVRIKKASDEIGPLPPELDCGRLEVVIQELLQRMDDAYLRSKIPEKPSVEDVAKVNGIVLDMRREMMS